MSSGLPLQLLPVLALVVSAAAHSQLCPPKSQTRHINGFTIGIAAHGEEDSADRCIATISKNGKRYSHVSGWSLEFDEVTGQDINADGQPDVVITEYSGGAHCCWTYSIFSLTSKPVLIANIYNERGIGFHRDQDGSFTLFTLDGAFDYFDGLCHACTVFPDVYLRLDHRRIIDVSERHLPEYDREISEAKASLSKEDLKLLKTISKPEEIDDVNVENRLEAGVLQIVFGYLYSGRETMAWKSLRELWIPSDVNRLKALIIRTRRSGVLRYVSRRPGKSPQVLQ